LGDQGSGGKKRVLQVFEYEKEGRRPANFPDHWRQPDVVGLLYAMQGRVCAYCGADVEESGIDVEHFRPKGRIDGDPTPGGYWWLAYEFTNYLLSCTICNQKNKRTAFPILDGGLRVCYEDRHLLHEEARALFDPASDDVESRFYFDWTSTSGRIIPGPGLAVDEVARVALNLQIFRVNKKAAQRRIRLALQREFVKKLDDNRAEEVREYAIRFRPHSIVARQILDACARWALPSPEEEIEWLFSNLSSDLVTKLEDLENPATATDVDEREAKELLWALAAIWKDPPTGDAEMIAAMLERWGLKELVTGYYEQL
jgi:uncharacterized protein (TIGR02646 family)